MTPNKPATTTIPTSRYIELLESENALLKLRFQPGANCKLIDITKNIKRTGMTVKQWAELHKLNYAGVRNTICGRARNRAVIEALHNCGLIEG